MPIAPDGRVPGDALVGELLLGELPPGRSATGDVTTGLDGVERGGEMLPLPEPVGLDGRAPWDPSFGEVTTGLEDAPAPEEWLLGIAPPGVESPGGRGRHCSAR